VTVFIKNQSEDTTKGSDSADYVIITYRLMKCFALVVTRCTEGRNDTTNCFLIPREVYCISCQKDW
jgi:hypothetical protein